MKVIDIIRSHEGHAFPSLEFVPPLKGGDIHKLYESLEPLMEFNPPYINITCHRDERSDGRIVSKRPGTVAIAAAVMKRFPIEVVPHLLCAYTTKEELENELIDLSFLDIENVMALRGETSPEVFEPWEGGYAYASELVSQISKMNRGEYLDAGIKDSCPTNFCIGVAGYPEKHHQAPDMDTDIRHLKDKVDAGADYIITQMFFDNSKFYEFEKKCRAAGITVPIIPGLKPVSMKKHLEALPTAFDIEMPGALVVEINRCKSDDQVYNLGIDWCIAQSRDLIAHGVPAVHYYTMGRAENIRTILKSVF